MAALTCQVWAACMTDLKDFVPFMLSRLSCGMVAAMPTIFGPSYATDIFFLHQRGRAFISYELSLIGGVVASPTIGGFIVDSKPWPYTFWWTIAPVGTALILVFCFLEETSFWRGEEDEVCPGLSEGFLRDRFATFFPGNKIIPRTSAQEVVGVNPFDDGKTTYRFTIDQIRDSPFRHRHGSGCYDHWLLRLCSIRVLDHDQHRSDHLSPNS